MILNLLNTKLPSLKAAKEKKNPKDKILFILKIICLKTNQLFSHLRGKAVLYLSQLTNNHHSLGPQYDQTKDQFLEFALDLVFHEEETLIQKFLDLSQNQKKKLNH